MSTISHISLQNFRLFKDKTSFDLAPVTILAGTNSSGKSSLIKAFVLFKSSLAKTRTLEILDFTGSGHNLNDFKNTLNYDSESDIIYFEFDFHLNHIGNGKIELGYKINKENPNLGDLISLVLSNSDEEIIFSSKIHFDEENEHHIRTKMDTVYFLDKLDFGNLNVRKNYGKLDLKYSFLSKERFLYDNIEENEYVYKEYIKGLNMLSTGGIITILEHQGIGLEKQDDSVISVIKYVGNTVINGIEHYLEKFGLNYRITDYGKFFQDDFSALILEYSLKSFVDNFDSIFHFSSVRSIPQKIYTDKEKELLKFFLRYEKEEKLFNSEIKQFVRHHLLQFAIGEKIIIVPHKDLLVELYVIKEGKEILLSDLGYGFTQLLPIIMRIALNSHDKYKNKGGEYNYEESLFLLEEPESNLHPAYQSKIAEMVTYATSKFNIRFIIETHSEYLIRKLQYLIAKGKSVNAEEVKIFYFNTPGTDEAEESLFRTIQIEPNGRLTAGFGSGFFDESDNIAFDLFMLNQERQN